MVKISEMGKISIVQIQILRCEYGLWQVAALHFGTRMPYPPAFRRYSTWILREKVCSDVMLRKRNLDFVGWVVLEKEERVAQRFWALA